MPSLTEYKPKTLPEYLECIESVLKKNARSLWYRGTGRLTYKLIPTLYRHPSITSNFELQELENQLLNRFRQRSLPYHSRDLNDDWEALFFMQHYGVPTRLLDWTENPLTGLHFALMSAKPARGSKGAMVYKNSACLWVLYPVLWNQTALKHVSYDGKPLTPNDDLLKGYSPKSVRTGTPAYPVALFGTHNSARIVAQQGVFTIFGENRDEMEKLVRIGAFPTDALVRIVITSSRIQAMREALLKHGITESTVFPDLEGLARETKRHFGFGG